MKFLGTDFSRKHISAKIGKEEVLISFYDSFWKGVHDVEIFTKGAPAKVDGTYPGFVRRVQEAMLLIEIKLKHRRKYAEHRQDY